MVVRLTTNKIRNGVGVEEKTFITSQKELAEAIGRTQEHFSAWKNRRANPSEELISEVKRITGIPSMILVSGSKSVLSRKLKEFFTDQRTRKMMNM